MVKSDFLVEQFPLLQNDKMTLFEVQKKKCKLQNHLTLTPMFQNIIFMMENVLRAAFYSSCFSSLKRVVLGHFVVTS